ncbi:Imm52 family immunity protein [Shewanella carassii]|uniref:Immunity protein 52 domain-containing protein n=1 Tax=Shewanella carassii TaxID=1987584 RepID=A0ABQ1SYW6_9GAMM|nr:Imm52 family immunity protein [Shewanella carassii]GGE72225.1 hypothetical protein GCM10011520_11080 [Shewanella carassii]
MIRAKEYMGFYWQDRQQCLDEYLSFIIDLLIGIEAAVERPCSFEILSKGLKLDVMPDDFLEQKSKIISLVLDPDVAYTEVVQEDSTVSLLSPLGFTSQWKVKLDCGPVFFIIVSSGAYGTASPGNSVVCKLDSPVESRVNELQFFRQVWRFLVTQCNPEFAVFTSHDLACKIDPDMEFDNSVGWISYVSSTVNSQSIPSDVIISNLANGCQLEVIERLIGVNDSEVVNLLRNTQNALVNAGIISVEDDF